MSRNAKLAMLMVAISLLTSAASSLGAQFPRLGAITLRIGMPREEALAKLRSRYLLTESDPLIIVSDKSTWTNGPNYGNVGNVSFTAGVLSLVNRAWTQASSAPRAELIFAALKQLEGESGCVVTNHSGHDPKFAFETLEILCGTHSVQVGSTRENGRTSIQATESWR